MHDFYCVYDKASKRRYNGFLKGSYGRLSLFADNIGGKKVGFLFEQEPLAEQLEDAEEKQALEFLLNMVDEGKINEAENNLYKLMEKADRSGLETALLFYSYLNEKSDEFLENHNFSRDEIKQGLEDVTSRYGVSEFAEMFLK